MKTGLLTYHYEVNFLCILSFVKDYHTKAEVCKLEEPRRKMYLDRVNNRGSFISSFCWPVRSIGL